MYVCRNYNGTEHTWCFVLFIDAVIPEEIAFQSEKITKKLIFLKVSNQMATTVYQYSILLTASQKTKIKSHYKIRECLCGIMNETLSVTFQTTQHTTNNTRHMTTD